MRRRLTPEERALWDRVRATAVPLRPEPEGSGPSPAGAPEPPSRAAPPPPAPPAAIRPFRIGEAAPDRPAGRGSPAPRPVAMDASAFRRLTRGRLRPEARLDLHGLTEAEAHAALHDFVLDARARGLRLLLVITGKGRPGRDEPGPWRPGPGRLRHDVPRWLALPPLAGAVLQVVPAHARHGGEGALYVYLRAGGTGRGRGGVGSSSRG